MKTILNEPNSVGLKNGDFGTTLPLIFESWK
jgi:hypothetical protein